MQTLPVQNGRRSSKRPVITLHGIRTHAKWQLDLDKELSAADFITVPLNYGFFGILKLILPWKRRKQVKWFREKYTNIQREYLDSVPSIIAHSFGTYIVAKSLELYDGVRFDTVILCGSIIPTDFDWQTIIQNGQVRRVLNECAKKDIVVKAAPYVIHDAGASGAYGFDIRNEQICQRYISKFGHSDYLHRLNFATSWIKFLEGGPSPNNRIFSPTRKNWRFWITVTVSMLLTSIAIYSGLILLRQLQTAPRANVNANGNSSIYQPNNTPDVSITTNTNMSINQNRNGRMRPNRGASIDTYISAARRSFQSGRCRESLEACNNALSIDPSNAVAKELKQAIIEACSSANNRNSEVDR